ncbi:neuropeptide-like protein 31 [Mya arenaria]|uniref:neuropeptide-like protein 31 n=1 Tax=Mya arenaria TaxID=6604 RepID=UPI0022E7E20C|nr:neuropeptide-like protein 31 [Mya arenaria]
MKVYRYNFSGGMLLLGIMKFLIILSICLALVLSVAYGRGFSQIGGGGFGVRGYVRGGYGQIPGGYGQIPGYGGVYGRNAGGEIPGGSGHRYSGGYQRGSYGQSGPQDEYLRRYFGGVRSNPSLSTLS